MNYLHPSLIKPVQNDHYIVICCDGAPRVAVWRNNMGDAREQGAYCSMTRTKRTTRFDALSGVLLVAIMPLPTQEQISAAEVVHNSLVTV